VDLDTGDAAFPGSSPKSKFLFPYSKPLLVGFANLQVSERTAMQVSRGSSPRALLLQKIVNRYLFIRGFLSVTHRFLVSFACLGRPGRSEPRGFMSIFPVSRHNRIALRVPCSFVIHPRPCGPHGFVLMLSRQVIFPFPVKDQRCGSGSFPSSPSHTTPFD